LLCSSWLATSFRGCNNHFRGHLAHRKPSLIKVIDIGIVYPVLRNYVSYEGKPRAIRVWIFAKDSLIVDSSIKTRLELRSSSYEV
jgi:hypothetical protein